MKKILSLALAASIAACAFGRPGPHFGPRIPHHPHHHWRAPLIGYTVGAIGAGIAAAAIASTWTTSAPVAAPAPAVVPPVVVPAARVWVPPVYETRPVYNTLGQIIGWQQVMVTPGYWR